MSMILSSHLSRCFAVQHREQRGKRKWFKFLSNVSCRMWLVWGEINLELPKLPEINKKKTFLRLQQTLPDHRFGCDLRAVTSNVRSIRRGRFPRTIQRRNHFHGVKRTEIVIDAPTVTHRAFRDNYADYSIAVSSLFLDGRDPQSTVLVHDTVEMFDPWWRTVSFHGWTGPVVHYSRW